MNEPTTSWLAIRDAETKGLRLAVLCRTIAVAGALIWVSGVALFVGYGPDDYKPAPLAYVALAVFAAFGLGTLAVIGTRFDRWWLKYALYAVDVFAVCALFVVMPVSRGADVPQIIAFRAYGIYYLFPFLALAALSLSWRLVAWTTLICVVGWWAAFAAVISPMGVRLSWDDMAIGAGREAYEAVFLSLDFVGYGNRVEETGLLAVAGLTLALAVYRARGVFFRQIEAEAQRARERQARERVEHVFGRYVPKAVADSLLSGAALAPKRTRATVLILDIAGFTPFVEGRDPSDVFERLGAFLARSSQIVADEGGVVIQFTGDGLLAVFGTPVAIDGAEQAAMRAALRLNADRNDSFTVRIGIASGPVAAGSIGSDDRQAFTIYGETVNRAARLEAAAKQQAGNLLCDDETARRLPVEHVRALGNISVPGLSRTVAVWEIVRSG